MVAGGIVFVLFLIGAVGSPSDGESSHISGEDIRNLFPVVVGDQDYAPVTAITNSTCLTYIYFYFYYTLIGGECRDIPVNKTVTDFDTMLIVLTGLEIIKENAFLTWSEVREIHISLNKKLREIEPGAFRGMNKVSNMSVADNPTLSFFRLGTFEGLTGLRSLGILKSNVIQLASLTPSLSYEYLPSLDVLILSHNSILDIGAEDFMPMNESNVRILKMEFVSVRHIEDGAFGPLRYLEGLILNQNDLNETECTRLVESLKELNPKVWELGLGTNDIGRRPTELFEALSSSNITKLDLSGNRFGPLTPSMFPSMPNVVTLDLSDVKAGDLPSGVINHEDFPSLETLILSSNRFGGLLDTMAIPGLKILDLSSNTANRHLGTLFLVTPDTISKFSAIDSLVLSGNYLETLDYGILDNVTHLKKLYLRDTSLHLIDDFVFNRSSELLYLDLSNNDFPKIKGMSQYTFAGLSGLEAMDLSSCYITSINGDVFTPLISLRYLSVRDNGLVSFDPATFVHNALLKEVDLRMNSLTPWDTRLFKSCRNLSIVLLDKNRVNTLTSAMLEDFHNLTNLNISNNPLSCDCQFYDNIQEHLHSGGSHAIWRKRNTCFVPKEYFDLSLLDFWQNTLNSNSCVFLSLQAKLAIWMSSFALIGLLVSTLSWYWRWEILYVWLEVKQRLGWLRMKRRHPDYKERDFKYDAFVSFSHQDRKFVTKMVAILEGEFKFNLCVYDRDFVAGDLICDSVIGNLATSRSIIMVLSESFVKSTWCQWELQIAQQRTIFFRRAQPDSIIVVKLSEIEPSLMTDTLKYLVKTRIFLKWDPNVRKQRVFWHQLNAAISKYK